MVSNVKRVGYLRLYSTSPTQFLLVKADKEKEKEEEEERK